MHVHVCTNLYIHACVYMNADNYMRTHCKHTCTHTHTHNTTWSTFDDNPVDGHKAVILVDFAACRCSPSCGMAARRHREGRRAWSASRQHASALAWWLVAQWRDAHIARTWVDFDKFED